MEHSIPLLTGEGWPNKRQALNLARPTVPAVKVSPELPSNRENLAENQQSKQQRGGCVGEQSWCWHLNTGCSCFLVDTPVISTFFFLIVSRKCRFFVHAPLHACASFASTDRTASTGSKRTGISHFDKYFQTAIPTYTPSDNSWKGSCFLALLSTHCAKKMLIFAMGSLQRVFHENFHCYFFYCKWG